MDLSVSHCVVLLGDVVELGSAAEGSETSPATGKVDTVPPAAGGTGNASAKANSRKKKKKKKRKKEKKRKEQVEEGAKLAGADAAPTVVAVVPPSPPAGARASPLWRSSGPAASLLQTAAAAPASQQRAGLASPSLTPMGNGSRCREGSDEFGRTISCFSEDGRPVPPRAQGAGLLGNVAPRVRQVSFHAQGLLPVDSPLTRRLDSSMDGGGDVPSEDVVVLRVSSV